MRKRKIMETDIAGSAGKEILARMYDEERQIAQRYLKSSRNPCAWKPELPLMIREVPEKRRFETEFPAEKTRESPRDDSAAAIAAVDAVTPAPRRRKSVFMRAFRTLAYHCLLLAAGYGMANGIDHVLLNNYSDVAGYSRQINMVGALNLKEGRKAAEPDEKKSALPKENGLSVLLEGEPSLSPETIDDILRENNSPAAGLGQVFYDNALRYGIDDAIALAFFRKESSFGTRGIAAMTKSMGNVRSTRSWKGEVYCYPGKGCYRDYGSWEEGIIDWYRLIKNSRRYVNGGNITVEGILPEYAPSSENDTMGYIDDVRGFVTEFRLREERKRHDSSKSAGNPVPLPLDILYSGRQLVNNEVVLVVGKSDYSLQLWKNWCNDEGCRLGLIDEYDVSIGRGGLGPKQRKGDRMTPEGDYFVSVENHSKFGWPTFRVNYPNRGDRERGRMLGTSDLGSGILIHATGSWNLGKRRTDGCIGMSRANLEEIYRQGVMGRTRLIVRGHLDYAR